MIIKKIMITLAGLALPWVSEAAIYMKLDGIRGEVAAEGYVDWLELASLNFGAGRAVSMSGSGSTRETSRPSFSEIRIQKQSGPASAQVILEAAAGGGGKLPAEIHITQINPMDGKQAPYYKLILTDPLLSSYAMSAGSDDPPLETLALAYTKLEERFPRTDGDKPQPDQVVWYDLTTDKSGSSGGGTVNLAPTITAIEAQSTAEDTSKDIAFTVADPDGSASALSLSRSSSNTALLPVDRISFSGSGSSRAVRLSPLPDQFGSASVTLSVSDGSKSASTTFTLTVVSQNDAPLISAPSSIQLLSNVLTPLVGISVNDVDAGALALTLSATVTQGTIQTNAAAAGVSVTGSHFSNVSLEGPAAGLNMLLSSPSGLLFRSYPGFSGTDLLTLHLDDKGNSGAGGAKTNQVTVSLRVFASAYELWQDSYFSADLGDVGQEPLRWGDAADPDGDGIPNLLEYALGLIPDLADAGDGPQLFRQIVGSDEFWVVSFERHPDPDVEVFVEVCSDLNASDWSADGAEIALAGTSQTNSMQQLIFQDQRAAGQATTRFYRISARRITNP